MTLPVGYDALVVDGTPPDLPTAPDITALLTDARRFRRALQAYADQVKEHRAAEPSPEIANQMEELIQNVTGQLYQLEKGVAALERVQGAARDYPDVVTRMQEIVAKVRAR